MKCTVLIVDDSSTIRKMVRRSLEMSGLEIGAVHEAENGREALEKMQAHWVDVVFVDLNMPIMGGMEMVQNMKKDDLQRTTPVVIVSSEHDERRVQELNALGVNAYIKKPFRPEAIRGVVHSIFGATAPRAPEGSHDF